MKKGQEGITLVALVITIIVLLILATVSVATLTGENGMFKRAKEAKNNTADAEIAQNEAMNSYEKAINNALGEE